jgi:ribonuclease VapC
MNTLGLDRTESEVLLDSSAIIALLLRESGWEVLQQQIDAAGSIAVGAATLLEAHMVLTGRTGKDALPLIDAFLSELSAEVVPFTASH